MSQRSNEVIGDFIEIYKSEPCLWKVTDNDYRNRDKRDAAYRKLVEKLKEIEPDANESSVRKKINSLRSNVRKEQKKIDSSRKSGASADDVYKPSLWYFELFDFLKDQDKPRSSFSNLSSESDNDEMSIGDPNPEESQLTPTASQNERREPNQPKVLTGISRPGPSTKRKSNDDISAEILSTVRDHFKRPQPQIDCCELLGRTVAMKMRGIKDKRTHIMFEKKIYDLLYEAEMFTLNYPNSTFTSPQHYYTPSLSPSPQHYTPSLSPSPQHYTPSPTPSPQHTHTPSMLQQQNPTSHNTDTASSFFSNFSDNFE